MAHGPRVAAPELEGAAFVGASGPVSLASLRGRVVLLDFWTSACINCLHVLEEIRELERRFGDDLVVIGVHSPKFPHEGSTAAVERAVRRLGIDHPVLSDPELLTWRAYGVHAWPTLVLIDPGGRVALQVSGEGRGPQIADAVETLLRAHEAAGDLVRGPLPHGRGAVPLHATGLRYPSKLAYDEQSGLLAISDTGHNRIVLLDYATRAVRSTIGTGARGAADGAFEVASFSSPQGVCFWQGSLWVADAGNHLLRKVDLERRNVETIPARLRSPWDVAPFGGLLTIAMAGSHQLWGYDIASGRFQALAGTGREGIVDGPAAQAELAQPSGLAASDRMLGFVDAETSSLRVVAPRPMGGFAIATVIGTGLFDWGTADGSSTDARMQHPQGLATVPGGWVVTDTFNHRLRRFSWETGQLTTLAGSTAGFADGIAAAARFDEPSGAVLVGDRVVVADTNNHALRSVDLATGAVDTLLPSGLAPPGTAPSLLAPATVAEGSEVEIEVTLHGPAGTRLDSSSGAPVRVHVSAEPSSLLAAPAEYSGDQLPARIAVRTTSGSGTLRVDVRGAFCDDHQAPGAACHLAEAAYLVPVTLTSGGTRALSVA